jgi:hypothetical protein
MDLNAAHDREEREEGLLLHFFCWCYAWILTPWRLLRWRVGFWFFARWSNELSLEQKLRDYLEAKVFLSRFQLGDERFLHWLRELHPGTRAFWLTDYLEARANNGGLGGLVYDAHVLGLTDEIAHALDFFGAEELNALFGQARSVFAQHLPSSGELPPWPEFAQVMGASVLEEKHSGLGTRFGEAMESLPAMRVSRVRKAPRLFV